jgi:hypothetical protein
VLIHLGIELASLMVECVHAALDVAAPPLVFGERDDTAQVRLREPVELVPQFDLPSAQVLTTSLKFLRKPVTAVRSLESMGNDLRVQHDLAQIVPYEFVELFGRSESRLASLRARSVSGPRLSRAYVVPV